MNCGQASEVNSDGTSFSAFARIGAAAIFMGISNSDNGSSGSVCCSSLAPVVFLLPEQADNKTIPIRRTGSFHGYLIIIWNEYNIPYGKAEVFHHLFCSRVIVTDPDTRSLESARDRQKHKRIKESATVNLTN